MTQAGGEFALPDSVAIVVIAGLLSLLPVFILLWVYYVRERRPTVPGSAMARFFALGMACVGGAVVLERGVYAGVRTLSPGAARAFFATDFIPVNLTEIAIAVAVSFGIVALIEEGVRYLVMRTAFDRAKEFDQIIDGVQLGLALGLGFAFVENTLYFLQLFRGLDFDTLVVVFFLRFLISTVGHLAFGGVMGYALARARIHPMDRSRYQRAAFFLPWLMHGLFDMLLTIQLSFYTVLLLVVPLAMLWFWFQDKRLFEVHVLHGRQLNAPVPPRRSEIVSPQPYTVDVLPTVTSCPNCYLPLREDDRRCSSCGLRLRRRERPPILPFLSKAS